MQGDGITSKHRALHITQLNKKVLVRFNFTVTVGGDADHAGTFPRRNHQLTVLPRLNVVIGFQRTATYGLVVHRHIRGRRLRQGHHKLHARAVGTIVLQYFCGGHRQHRQRTGTGIVIQDRSYAFGITHAIANRIARTHDQRELLAAFHHRVAIHRHRDRFDGLAR